MAICCNCKAEATLMLHVYPECFSKIRDLQVENKQLREFLNKASQVLQDNGFEAESKAIDCVAEL